MPSILNTVLVFAFVIGTHLNVFSLRSMEALAEVVKVNNVTIDFPVPERTCVLSEKDPQEEILLSFMRSLQKGINEVAVMFIDCDQLSKVVAGESEDFGFYGTWLFPKNEESGEAAANLGDMTNADYIAYLSNLLENQGMPDLGNVIQNQVNSTAEEFMENELMEEVKIEGFEMGILEKSENSIYLAIAMDMASSNQGMSTAGVSALTSKKGHAVSLNVYDNYRNDQTYVGLLTSAKQLIQRLENQSKKTNPFVSNNSGLAKNLPSATLPSFAEPIEIREVENENSLLSRVLEKGLSGAVVGFILALFFGLMTLIRKK